MRRISIGGAQGGTFGVMEGTIMMLGVLLGLSVTQNRFVIVLGLLTAGIADSFANSASFYVSEESELIHTRKEVFRATKLCFLGTLVTVALIALPIIFISNIKYAIISSLAVGLLILLVFGNYMSKKLHSATPSKTIIKYMAIGMLTAAVCFLVGELLEYASSFF